MIRADESKLLTISGAQRVSTRDGDSKIGTDPRRALYGPVNQRRAAPLTSLLLGTLYEVLGRAIVLILSLSLDSTNYLGSRYDCE